MGINVECDPTVEVYCDECGIVISDDAMDSIFCRDCTIYMTEDKFKEWIDEHDNDWCIGCFTKKLPWRSWPSGWGKMWVENGILWFCPDCIGALEKAPADMNMLKEKDDG